MDYFEDYLLPQIYEQCSRRSDPWECFINKVNLLPVSSESKKMLIRNFIDRKIGRKTFLAAYLAKLLYQCDYYGICDPKLPEILPEDITMQIFRIIREVRNEEF